MTPTPPIEQKSAAFWINLSDDGTPIVTNGLSGRNRVFVACETQEEAEERISELEAAHAVTEPETPLHVAPRATGANSRIMYIERKAGQLIGTARIGLVVFSRTRRTLYYQGKAFQSLHGAGFKSNYIEVDTGEEYWISGCKADGGDRLYGERIPVEIDEDVRNAYWTEIRKQPQSRQRRYSNM